MAKILNLRGQSANVGLKLIICQIMLKLSFSFILLDLLSFLYWQLMILTEEVAIRMIKKNLEYK